MANPLTGDYEAVLQVSVRQLNGLLATMHQNRWEKEQTPGSKQPTFAHSGEFRIGTPAPFLDPAVLRFQSWLTTRRAELAEGEQGSLDASGLMAKFPPGAAEQLMEGFLKWQDALHHRAGASTVSGRAQVQFAAPFTIFANGTTKDFTVHTQIRARYIGDMESHLLPEYIHGEVRITYHLRGENSTLKILPPEEDREISFISDTSIPFVVDSAINAEVRRVVRERFRPSAQDFGANFKYLGFKALGTGSTQALALPIPLSENPATTGSLNRITTNLLGGQDFAVIVSREYITSQFEPALQTIRSIRKQIGPILTVSYVLSVNSADLVWSQGFVELKISAKAQTHHIIAGIIGDIAGLDLHNLSVVQKMLFQRNGNNITLTASDNDLTVNLGGLPSDVENDAKASIGAVLRSFLPNVQQWVQKALGNEDTPGVGQGLLRRLGVLARKIDFRQAVAYTGHDVTPHGLVLRGAVSGGKRIAPIADIRKTDGGDAYTALHSWVPGGQIKDFYWTMKEKTPFVPSAIASGLIYTLPWDGKLLHTGKQVDNFMFPYAWTLSKGTAVCLGFDGVRRNIRGIEEEVTGYTTIGGSCFFVFLPPILILPNWKEFSIPNIWPDPGFEGNFSQQICMHVDAVAHDWPGGGLTTNHLVHFADWNAELPLQGIHEALALMKRRQFSMTLVVVVPVGGLDMTRAEVEFKLGLAGHRKRVEKMEGQAPIHFQITEDNAGGWSNMFRPSKSPATYLVDAKMNWAWGMDGEVDPGELAAVLDEKLVPAPAAQGTLPDPAVLPGQRVPDVQFVDDKGNFTRLWDYDQHEILLCFWKSWSEPCKKELLRLQKLQREEEVVVMAL
ncbi:MAG TPA: hypothetical protein VLE43_21425, partial [Candidatus Saccharimonadia bacterium]|nr:hypothetical protein [Candidatus Saccharimonadia bacterium]